MRRGPSGVAFAHAQRARSGHAEIIEQSLILMQAFRRSLTWASAGRTDGAGDGNRTRVLSLGS